MKRFNWKHTYELIDRQTDTVFDLITTPALITTPPLTFHFIFTYYRPLDDLFLDFLLYFHLSPLDDLLALVVENKFT